jgi:hypothetical protein
MGKRIARGNKYLTIGEEVGEPPTTSPPGAILTGM